MVTFQSDSWDFSIILVATSKPASKFGMYLVRATTRSPAGGFYERSQCYIPTTTILREVLPLNQRKWTRDITAREGRRRNTTYRRHNLLLSIRVRRRAYDYASDASLSVVHPYFICLTEADVAGPFSGQPNWANWMSTLHADELTSICDAFYVKIIPDDDIAGWILERDCYRWVEAAD